MDEGLKDGSRENMRFTGLDEGGVGSGSCVGCVVVENIFVRF